MFTTLDGYPSPEVTVKDDIRSFLNDTVLAEQDASPEVRQACSRG